MPLRLQPVVQMKQWLPRAGIILCFCCFDLPQFRGVRLAATAALLWLFGLAALPQTYFFSFAFEVRGGVRALAAGALCGHVLPAVRVVANKSQASSRRHALRATASFCHNLDRRQGLSPAGCLLGQLRASHAARGSG
jgi:hypothetical protein